MDEGIAVYSFKTAGKGEDFGGNFSIFFSGRHTTKIHPSHGMPWVPRARWYQVIWDIKCPSLGEAELASGK